MGAGIGSGIAFNKCADEFNRIHTRELRVARSLKNEGKDDFFERWKRMQHLFGEDIKS